MAYEPIEGLEIHAEKDEPCAQRRLLVAAGVIALAIILVLVLLLLPRCSADSAAGSSGQKRQIVAVPEAPAEAGSVSVWIEKDLAIASVLSKAGIGGAATSDMGDGRYVINVEPGTEREVVTKLRGTAGVYDAGFVFADDSTATAQ